MPIQNRKVLDVCDSDIPKAVKNFLHYAIGDLGGHNTYMEFQWGERASILEDTDPVYCHNDDDWKRICRNNISISEARKQTREYFIAQDIEEFEDVLVLIDW